MQDLAKARSHSQVEIVILNNLEGRGHEVVGRPQKEYKIMIERETALYKVEKRKGRISTGGCNNTRAKNGKGH